MEQQSFLAVANRDVSPRAIQPTTFVDEYSAKPTGRVRAGEYHRHQYDSIHHTDASTSRLHEVFLIGVIVCSLLTLVSLFQLKSVDTHGWAFFLNHTFGGLSYLVPAYLTYIGIILYKYRKTDSQNGEMLLFLVGNEV